MDADLRQFFDEQMDEVVQAMPEQVHRLLDDVTMYVEDHPSREVMQSLRISAAATDCAAFTPAFRSEGAASNIRAFCRMPYTSIAKGSWRRLPTDAAASTKTNSAARSV